MASEQPYTEADVQFAIDVLDPAGIYLGTRDQAVRLLDAVAERLVASGIAEGLRQATEGAEHLRRPFFHTESESGVTLAVTYQGTEGLAFVAQPRRPATEPYEQYGVVLPLDVARDLALRMLASVGPWEPAPVTDVPEASPSVDGGTSG